MDREDDIEEEEEDEEEEEISGEDHLLTKYLK